ncbi:MAG: DUF2837 family protein [Bacillaceae bacterium]|nr:DUF2837 family protein [Bacillaceae bacterium]
MQNVWIVTLLVISISMVETFAYGARLAGARTRRLSSSLSLFNILVLFARTANLFQSMFVAMIVDEAVKTGEPILWVFRVIIFSASIGVFLGILSLPFSTRLFEYGVRKLEQHGTVPRIFNRELRLRNFRKVARLFSLPTRQMIRQLDMSRLPYGILITNMVIYSIFAVGVLASYYASTMEPAYTRLALSMSGFINGMATIGFAIFVDPYTAKLQDDVIQGKQNLSFLRSVIVFLSLGRLLGTFLAQVIFLPAVYVILHLMDLALTFFGS